MATTPRFPFRLKLLVLTGTLAIVPVVAIGVGLIDINTRGAERQSRALQIALADDLARTVEEESRSTERALRLVARLLGDGALPEDVRAAVPTSFVDEDGAIDHIAIYDVTGSLIDVARADRAARLDVPESLPVALRSPTDAHPAASAAAQVRVAPIEAQSGEPRLPMAVPIVAGGRRTGFVATSARLVGIQRRVERIHEAQFAEGQARLFVVDEDLRVIAHPDAELAHALPSFAARPTLEGVEPRTLRAGVPRSAEAVVDDDEVVATVVGLEGRPWAIVVEVPREVAYATLHQTRRAVVVAVVAAALFALLVAFFAAQRVTAPIASLAAFARDLAGRRFDRRVSLTTGDELELLADAMSYAATELERSEATIREEAAIRADLGRYLPAELVDKVVAREQDMGLGGVRREITVLFADVVAFTPLTERLGPEEVVSLLNELFTVLTELVFRHHGTVDKFVGDCVMAVFGAPGELSDHATAALECAEDMMSWLATANPGWEARYGVTVQLAIGVNSGEAVVGNVGSERRMEYTAIGDVVNVAARLEAIARPMQVLVSRATRDAAGDAFDFAEVGERVLSGQQDPIELFEVRS